MAFKLDMTVDLSTAYMLMLVAMTSALLQGHSGSADENNKLWYSNCAWRYLYMTYMLILMTLTLSLTLKSFVRLIPLVFSLRISVIFYSRKKRKVHMPDRRLLKRLVPMPVVMAVYLTCWSVIKHPHVITVVMDKKKFFSCSFDYWNYTVFGGT